MHSIIISPGSWVSDFAGKSHVQKLSNAQTKQANITGTQHNLRRSTGSGINFVMSLFILLLLCANYHILHYITAASRRCCRGLPLKYRVQYSRSRHRQCFRYVGSNTTGKKLLCRPLLRKKWSWSHPSRRCRSAEWNAVNVFSPNTPTLVLTHMYCHHTHCHASLLPSSSSALTTIRVFFVVPIVPPLCRISAHIRSVSAHCRPLRLCSPHATISFVPIIYSHTIARMFCFSGAGTPSPVSATPILLLSLCANSLLLLSVATDS